MSRVRSISLPSRRLVPLLFVIAVAGLLALGVAIDPSSRSTPEPDSGSSSSGSTDSITEQPLVQPTPGTTEQFEGELGNVTEREWIDKDGGKRKSMDVRVSDVALMGGKREAAPAAPRPAAKPAAAGSGFDDMDDSSIPF